jgi:hypothetical protein
VHCCADAAKDHSVLLQRFLLLHHLLRLLLTLHPAHTPAVHCSTDAAKDHSALLQRFEGVSAELSRVKEGAADMRLRLEHFTGPAGPQARIRQLEATLQSVSGVGSAA